MIKIEGINKKQWHGYTAADKSEQKELARSIIQYMRHIGYDGDIEVKNDKY